MNGFVNKRGRDWSSIERFPESSGRWELIRVPFKRVHCGQMNVDRALRKWHVYDPVVVATPDSTRFLPPICIPELSAAIHRNIVRRHEAFLLMLSLAFILVLGTYLAWPGNSKLMYALLLLGAGIAYVAFDTYFIQKKLENLADRAMLVHFIVSSDNFSLKAFVGAMAVSGIAQAYLQQAAGGLDELIIRYGAYFPAIEAGQWWRYLSGPFIHSGPLHWISNFVIGVLSIGLAGAFGRRTLLLQFIVIISLSVLAVQYSPFGVRSDAFVGLSGGIFGMFGWSVAYFFRLRNVFPRLAWVSIGLISMLNIACAAATSAHASQTAHVAGFLMGSVFGLCKFGWHRSGQALDRK